LGSSASEQTPRHKRAEFALIVSDSYHPRGLGTELLRRLLQIGQEEKLEAIVGYILTSNYSRRKKEEGRSSNSNGFSD
jgi:RimJ/RimL family protein N-acetyltransferase